MHYIIKNQVSGQIEGILCIERESHTGIILKADIDRLSELVSIARGLKVPSVQLIVPKTITEQLEAYGWKLVTELVVMTKE
jgi:hypothetical protein